MRGALGATVAAVRAYRRSDEHRRVAAEASWLRLAERSRFGATFPESPQRSRVRRSLVASGVAMMLVAAGLLAVFLGASSLDRKAQPGVPYIAVDPHAAAPAISSSATAVSDAASGRAPVTLSPGASAPAVQTPGVAGAAGSAANLGAPAVTNTPVAVGSPSATEAAASGSPSLLDLCRIVVAAGNGWPSVLKGADRATVIAAAGKKKNVLAYCTALAA